MLLAQRRYANISLLLVLCLLLAPFVDAAGLSLFDKLKLKTQQKAEQVQQRDWWITKAAGKVAGFVTGKAVGALGAGIGFVIGTTIGGPVAAGMGAMIGYRIGDIAAKTFGKAVGELLAQWKLHHGRKVDLGAVVDAIKSVNKASLSAESIGAVFGDLVGGSLGAAAGIALLAGATPFAIPLLGTVSAAYLGSKLGTAIGRGIGRWIGRKALKKGYEAYATTGVSEADDKKEEAELESTLVKIEDPTPTGAGPDNTLPETKEAVSAAASAASPSVMAARATYEKAYREYTDTVTSPAASSDEKKARLQQYREAYEAYQAAVNLSGQRH